MRYEALELRSMLEEFEQRYGGIELYYLRVKTEMDMLKKAMEKAGSGDPQAVAFALEDMSIETPFGTATMRAADHQLMQPLFMSTFGEDYLEYDSEGTGFGWKMDAEIPADETRVETSCEMKRPTRAS